MKKLLLITYSFFLFMPSSPSWSIQLSEVTINDPILGVRSIVFEKIDKLALAEGDILVGKPSQLDRKSAMVLSKISGGLWENGVIPYEISEDLPFPSKLAVYQAIDVWQQKTHMEFVELTSKNREKYSDYIFFEKAPGKICASHVGRQGGRQEIKLSPRCQTMSVVHEIGHALGLWHEQSRLDRDFYVKILWENIEPGHCYNFNQHLTDGKDFGEYDYLSIMHYAPFAFSKNGEKTIVPLLENAEIGQRKSLSEKDVAAVNAMYPRDIS
jgi:hypothetical protein